MSPTVHRLGTAAHTSNSASRILSLHSPTTALAQLNFTQPSPVMEESTPAGTPADDGSDAGLSELESTVFSQLPVTAVDQLCFMSCFACVDTSARHSIHAKRLCVDDLSHTTVPTNTNLTHTAAGGTQVRLRSHVKRPLVRPSSIAFSSVMVDDNTSVLTASTFSREQTTKLGAGNACRLDHVARKSRSLEDILNSPPELSSEGQTGGVRSGGLAVTRLPSAVEMLGSSACTDIRCWPIADDRPNDASPGSHNSVHGSVEVIEVS